MIMGRVISSFNLGSTDGEALAASYVTGATAGIPAVQPAGRPLPLPLPLALTLPVPVPLPLPVPMPLPLPLPWAPAPPGSPGRWRCVSLPTPGPPESQLQGVVQATRWGLNSVCRKEARCAALCGIGVSAAVSLGAQPQPRRPVWGCVAGLGPSSAGRLDLCPGGPGQGTRSTGL